MPSKNPAETTQPQRPPHQLDQRHAPFRPKMVSSSSSLSSSNRPSNSSWFESVGAAFDTTYASLTGVVSHMVYKTPLSSSNSMAAQSRYVFTGSNYRTHNNWSWIWRNPYNSVRGRNFYEQRPSSMAAVRSLLALVVPSTKTTSLQHEQHLTLREDDDEEEETLSWLESGAQAPQEQTTSPHQQLHHHQQQQQVPPFQSIQPLQPTQENSRKMTHKGNVLSSPETASQLAEGTIRALRDLALEEAVELQQALRYWNQRWEQPLQSWLEAGPWVWFSTTGYNHQRAGHRVAQIQAVLARRCSAIGELQQHLLRADWQQGTQQWAVLIHGGGEWAAVAGFDGADRRSDDQTNLDGSYLGDNALDRSPTITSFANDHTEWATSSLEAPAGTPQSAGFGSSPRFSSSGNHPSRRARHHRSSKIFVQKNDGGGLFVEDPGFLAEWSVEAMTLIRKHLYRAGNGLVMLPFESNWRTLPMSVAQEEAEDGNEVGELISAPDPRMHTPHAQLPAWASYGKTTVVEGEKHQQVTITNLPLLAAEVEELLDIMEHVMEIQRKRRLDHLRPPSWLRRNWYMVAASLPTLGSCLLWTLRKGRGKALIQSVVHSVSSFLKERLRDPVLAICEELYKGRESFSDKKARMEAMETLKMMIRSWLDDYYPNMPKRQRREMANAMDVSLIEAKKEESMKTFYEINNVIRMSFIEMQYMKKEMMNALHAMDEMMSANDINMNIAAITPAVILAYMGSRIFRFVFYAFLKLGKSREETYGSFRSIITDIERLLVMRDNPPLPPQSDADNDIVSVQAAVRRNQLGPDDLGMVLLLVYECRRILWQDRRRFSKETIKSVSEDLAELAGERGPVSVQQQLQIINRMCRTYPFLKVVSTGKMFDFH